MKLQHKIILIVVAAGFAFWAVGKAVTLYCDYLWFDSLGYAEVFTTALATRAAIGVGVFLAVGLWLTGNAWLAARLAPGRRLTFGEVHPWLTPMRLRRLLRVAAALVIAALALGIAMGYTDDWYVVQQCLNRTAFGWTDPIFGYDAGWYVFVLPILERLQRFVLLLAATGLVAATAAYFMGGAIGTRYIRMTRTAMRHLAALGALFFLAVAFGYWLKRFGLLLETHGAVFGVGWVAHHVRIPAYNLMVLVSAATAGLVLAAGLKQRKDLLVLGGGLLVGMHLVACWIVPAAVQSVHVQPNELALEEPYIAHNIAATRYAFGLDQVEVREYPAAAELTPQGLASSPGTTRNVRLWDYRVLRDTYQEFQGLRPYYRFNQPDVDRYRFGDDYRQVSIALRELDQRLLVAQSRTWVNQHLLYTHGYGLVMNPVNRVTAKGSPEFWIENIPPQVAPEAPVAAPRAGVYFGEYTHGYIFTGTREPEFDYPLRAENQYTTYRGRDGVPVTGFWRKLLFAYYFSDHRILFTDSFTPATRVSWDREVVRRARRLAPFLDLEMRWEPQAGRADWMGGRTLLDPVGDPYPVVHDGRIVWILDAYTRTKRFPYSAPVGHTDPAFRRMDPVVTNYMRNAVKIAVDAYDGTVTFYVADPQDPLIRTARKIFPSLLADLAEMPEGLRAHLRYPLNLFDVQADRYMLYHMTDPKVFYNKEDLWQRPKETYTGDRRAQVGAPAAVDVASYYIIMTLPGETEPEYLLMLPFTPRGKNNMVGWMAARCDGEHYGRLLVFQFPKDRLVPGPNLVEAMIDKDDEISKQITLWNQMGSRVLRGNLLVIPIGESVLYVEPLYLDSEQTPFPELKRVIAATKDRLAMRETLEDALAGVLGQALPRPPVGPAEEAGDEAALKARALDLFEQARRQSRDGDWGGYGRTMDELEGVLRRLAAPPAPPNSE